MWKWPSNGARHELGRSLRQAAGDRAQTRPSRLRAHCCVQCSNGSLLAERNLVFFNFRSLEWNLI